MNPDYRIGTGYDVHALKTGIPLFLGGVKIPHHSGLAGHSDGDALIHAVVDAIFGALRIGDLGDHFPSSDQKWKGAESLRFLHYAGERLRESNYELVFTDSTIIAQKPSLKTFIPEMQKIMARALECSEKLISIKATTTDHLGFAGREEGIAAQAICLLKPTGAKT